MTPPPSPQSSADLLLELVHEIRTPLAALSLAADLLPDAEESDVVRQACRHISALVSYAEAAVSPTRPAGQQPNPVHVPGCVDEAVAMVAPLFTHRSVTVAVTVDENPGLAAADTVTVRRILVNLLGNAVRYSPVGGSVTVHVTRDDTHVRVTVTDSGPGVSGEIREQLLHGKVPSSDGWGMGLSISAAAAQQHGGTLRLLPTGPGASFELRIPQHRP